MTTIVLGWDGLDADLLRDFGMRDQFGANTHRIDTLTNERLGKPHTFELWPTMVTGVPPAEHGIRADEYVHGTQWSSSLLNWAARLSKHTVPEPIRWRVGRAIRGQGATFDFESLDYYRERGVETIFDGRQAVPLGVPNCRSTFDDELGIEIDRGAYLSEYLDVSTGEDGETVHSPSVSIQTLASRLEADVGQKVGILRSVLPWDYDIVFVWLAFVDTVGHVAPTVDDSESWVRSAYETAADYTEMVREAAGEDDTVICVSDHGLRAGAHTQEATIGSWPASATDGVEGVLDVATAIDESSPQTKRLSEPHSAKVENGEFESVGNRLADLGYIEPE